MYLLTTLPVGTYKWRLLYKQITSDDIVKHSCYGIRCLYGRRFDNTADKHLYSLKPLNNYSIGYVVNHLL